MKRILFFVAILFIAQFSIAQNYTIPQGDTITAVAVDGEYGAWDFEMVNNTNDSMYLAWNVVYNDFPAGWDYSWCDFNQCYFGTNSGTMATIYGPQNGFLKLNLNPIGGGHGTVRAYVYETAYPNNGDTVTWIIDAWPASVNELNNEVAINAYPNPATSVLNFNNSTSTALEVSVVDCLGKVVKQMIVQPGLTTLNVASLEEGLYFVTYSNSKGIRESKRVIIQN